MGGTKSKKLGLGIHGLSKQEIIEKSALSKEELQIFLSLISSKIEFVPKEELSH